MAVVDAERGGIRSSHSDHGAVAVITALWQ